MARERIESPACRRTISMSIGSTRASSWSAIANVACSDKPVYFRRRRIQDRLQIVQTLFVRDVSSPVNRITAELVIAPKIVDFRSSERVALCVEKEEQTQLTGFVTRIEHHRGSVHRHINTAGAVDYLKIYCDTGSNFELVTYPEPAVGGISFAGDDGAIDFGL